MTAKRPLGAKVRWTINYHLDGNIEVEAASADEAEEWFDNQFKNGLPRFVHDAEVVCARPVKTEDIVS